MPGITESTEEDSTAGCSIQCVLGQTTSPQYCKPSVYLDRYWHIQGDKTGCLYLWDMRSVLAKASLSPLTDKSPVGYDTSCALADSWEPPALPCALTDTLVNTYTSVPYFAVPLDQYLVYLIEVLPLFCCTVPQLILNQYLIEVLPLFCCTVPQLILDQYLIEVLPLFGSTLTLLLPLSPVLYTCPHLGDWCVDKLMVPLLSSLHCKQLLSSCYSLGSSHAVSVFLSMMTTYHIICCRLASTLYIARPSWSSDMFVISQYI